MAWLVQLFGSIIGGLLLIYSADYPNNDGIMIILGMVIMGMSNWFKGWSDCEKSIKH